MTLKAIIHEAEEGGYWAEVPALPGCVTQGETVEDVTLNLREAVEGWLSAQTPEAPVAQSDRIIELAVSSRCPARSWRGWCGRRGGAWPECAGVTRSS